MPCYITGTESGDAKLSRDEARKTATKNTALLCLLCEAVEYHDVEDVMPVKVKKWWNRHKAVDVKRKLREKMEKNEIRKRKMAEYKKLKKELGK